MEQSKSPCRIGTVSWNHEHAANSSSASIWARLVAALPGDRPANKSGSSFSCAGMASRGNFGKSVPGVVLSALRNFSAATVELKSNKHSNFKARASTSAYSFRTACNLALASLYLILSSDSSFFASSISNLFKIFNRIQELQLTSTLYNVCFWNTHNECVTCTQ